MTQMNSTTSPGEHAGHDGLSEEINKLRRDMVSLKDSLARLASQAAATPQRPFGA
jgi:hypothetical protein